MGRTHLLRKRDIPVHVDLQLDHEAAGWRERALRPGPYRLPAIRGADLSGDAGLIGGAGLGPSLRGLRPGVHLPAIRRHLELEGLESVSASVSSVDPSQEVRDVRADHKDREEDLRREDEVPGYRPGARHAVDVHQGGDARGDQGGGEERPPKHEVVEHLIVFPCRGNLKYRARAAVWGVLAGCAVESALVVEQTPVRKTTVAGKSAEVVEHGFSLESFLGGRNQQQDAKSDDQSAKGQQSFRNHRVSPMESELALGQQRRCHYASDLRSRQMPRSSHSSPCEAWLVWPSIRPEYIGHGQDPLSSKVRMPYYKKYPMQKAPPR